MWQALKDYFDLHARERRGLVALSVILFLLLITMFLITAFVEPEMEGRDKLEARINRIMAERDSLIAAKEHSKFEKQSLDSVYQKKREIKLPQMFRFDPNTLSDKGWEQLGLNSGQIRTINNYKSKGGQYRKPEDFAKMYCISKEQFELLAPYITIVKEEKEVLGEPESLSTEKSDSTSYAAPKKLELWIDINQADTSELKLLNGIGSYYATKIVTYREELGGYVSKEQLFEIWKFRQETFDKIEDQIHLGDIGVQKININECDIEELKEHPYISWSQARALISYRDQHGEFEQIDHIKRCHLITEETCQKLQAYLKID